MSSPPIRVLHVNAGREWRGGQNQTRLLVRELAAFSSVSTTLITRRHSELAARVRRDAPGIELREVPWGPAVDLRALWEMRRALIEVRPAIVHAHEAHALRLALWARRLAGLASLRVIATRRVDFHARFGSAWFRADLIIAISQAVRGILIGDGVPAERIRVVASGIDPGEVRRAAARPLDIRGRLGLAPTAPLAVHVAALVAHKDQQTLVRAAAAARTLAPDLHWVVAGEGEFRARLEAQIARLGLRDHVHLLGYVRESDALIAEGNVFVMSSKEEGLGTVVLHALALGKPVVATRGGGIPEMLPSESLVPIGDADALARKVASVLAFPQADASLLPSQFTARSMAHGVLAVYQSVV